MVYHHPSEQPWCNTLPVLRLLLSDAASAQFARRIPALFVSTAVWCAGGAMFVKLAPWSGAASSIDRWATPATVLCGAGALLVGNTFVRLRRKWSLHFQPNAAVQSEYNFYRTTDRLAESAAEVALEQNEFGARPGAAFVESMERWVVQPLVESAVDLQRAINATPMTLSTFLGFEFTAGLEASVTAWARIVCHGFGGLLGWHEPVSAVTRRRLYQVVLNTSLLSYIRTHSTFDDDADVDVGGHVVLENVRLPYNGESHRIFRKIVIFLDHASMKLDKIVCIHDREVGSRVVCEYTTWGCVDHSQNSEFTRINPSESLHQAGLILAALVTYSTHATFHWMSAAVAALPARSWAEAKESAALSQWATQTEIDAMPAFADFLIHTAQNGAPMNGLSQQSPLGSRRGSWNGRHGSRSPAESPSLSIATSRSPSAVVDATQACPMTESRKQTKSCGPQPQSHPPALDIDGLSMPDDSKVDGQTSVSDSLRISPCGSSLPNSLVSSPSVSANATPASAAILPEFEKVHDPLDHKEEQPAKVKDTPDEASPFASPFSSVAGSLRASQRRNGGMGSRKTSVVFDLDEVNTPPASRPASPRSRRRPSLPIPREASVDMHRRTSLPFEKSGGSLPASPLASISAADLPAAPHDGQLNDLPASSTRTMAAPPAPTAAAVEIAPSTRSGSLITVVSSKPSPVMMKMSTADALELPVFAVLQSRSTFYQMTGAAFEALGKHLNWGVTDMEVRGVIAATVQHSLEHYMLGELGPVFSDHAQCIVLKTDLSGMLHRRVYPVRHALRPSVACGNRPTDTVATVIYTACVERERELVQANAAAGEKPLFVPLKNYCTDYLHIGCSA